MIAAPDLERDVVAGARLVSSWSRGVIRELVFALAWHVSGRNHHRKAPFVGAFVVLQCLDVADRDANLFSGQDVRDLLLEDVWLFLV